MKKRFAAMFWFSALFSVNAVLAAPQSASVSRSTPVAPVVESVPRLVQFNGTLKDVAARPVAGVVSVSFSIYAEQDGGTALWSETQNVLADVSGHYNVLLGSATTNGVPAELFGTGQSRWLGITVARQPEMARVLMASVPYALKAADADTLGGLPASEYVTTRSLASKQATGPLVAGNTTIIEASSASTSAASQDATQTATPFATPSGSGTTNFIPKWTSSSALGNSVMFQSGSNIGIGTTSPAETLDVNGNSIFRGSFQLPPGHPATAASGFESHSFQFQASAFNSDTGKSTTQSFGFRAEPNFNNSSTPSALLDLFFIPNGGSEFQNTGVSFNPTGVINATGLDIFANTTSTPQAPNAILIANTANAAHTQSSVAIQFQPLFDADASKPAAQLLVTDDGNNSAFLEYDIRKGGSPLNGLQSVIDIDSEGETTFNGNVFVVGTLSKLAGSFKIDDPIAPAEKYLEHSFVESPDMMNIYNGIVILDAHGKAAIQMPAWFSALNQDFRYTLTAMGTAAPKLHIAEEMQGNQFSIAGGKKGQKVSWQVTGIRHDAWANAHRIPTEELKSPNEQGHYISPELFGAGPDKAISAAKHGASKSDAPQVKAVTDSADEKKSQGATD
jgi:hypothetical protein